MWGTTTYQDTFRIDSTQTRTGVQVRPSTTVIKSRTSRVIDTSIVPWVRERDVVFEAFGLRPNTRHYISINLIDISAWVRPYNANTDSYQLQSTVRTSWTGNNTPVQYAVAATPTSVVTRVGSPVDIVRDVYADVQLSSSSITPDFSPGAGTIGTLVLTTNESGYCKGTFKIPNIPGLVRFPAGNLRVIISDRAANFSSASSWAEATYYSQGYIDTVQETIVSLRLPTVYGATLTETRTVSSTVTEDRIESSSSYNWYGSAGQYSYDGGRESYDGRGNADPNGSFGSPLGDMGRSSDEGGTGGSGKIFCTYFKNIGWLPKEVWMLDMRHYAQYGIKSVYIRTAQAGYLRWATPIVKWLENGRETGFKTFMRHVIWSTIAKPWAYQQASLLRPDKYSSNRFSYVVKATVIPFSFMVEATVKSLKSIGMIKKARNV